MEATLGRSPWRSESLDCVRGIAACTVLFAHAIGFEPVEKSQRFMTVWDPYPVRLLWSGHQAVILFFVLSGFALYVMFKAMSAAPERHSVILMFVTSRWLRLYPTYIFSIFTALVFFQILNPMQLRYPDHFALASGRVEAWNLIGHIFLLGWFDTLRFNGSIWSIIYELRISIIFPIIYLLVCRLGAKTLILVIAIPLAAAVAISIPVIQTNNALTELVFTIHYSSFFFLGALVAHSRLELTQRITQYSLRNTLVLMACSLALYTYGSTFWKPLYTWCLADIVAGLASGGIIILSVSFPILEKSEILAWLGKISYSLYLMHAICLNVAYRLLIYKLPFPLLLVVMVVMSITVSALTWRLIEQRSLCWSRAIRLPQKNIAAAPVV